jgi:hypothetical protein
MQEPHPSGTDERPSVAPGDRPADGDPAAPAVPAQPVEVAVKRTGGFAGMTKQWRAEPPADEASVWIDLIAQCPWDAPSSVVPARGDAADGRPPAGADRFTWWIRARCGEQDEREAELPDDEVVGAWRELVDAVRDWSRSART